MTARAQKKLRQKRFTAIEASFRIEGMDPGADPVYKRAKAAVLSGSVTPRQALADVVAQSTPRRRRIAAAG